MAGPTEQRGQCPLPTPASLHSRATVTDIIQNEAHLEELRLSMLLLVLDDGPLLIQVLHQPFVIIMIEGALLGVDAPLAHLGEQGVPGIVDPDAWRNDYEAREGFDPVDLWAHGQDGRCFSAAASRYQAGPHQNTWASWETFGLSEFVFFDPFDSLNHGHLAPLLSTRGEYGVSDGSVPV